MEKSILKTLIYADIFDYPLKIKEMHKWLIGKKMNLREMEKILRKLNQESRLMNHGSYYFLPERSGLETKRKRRERQSDKFLFKAKVIAMLLKIIPWIKLVGISGGLAMNNASKKDDIDFFIIASKNRLWLSRFFAITLLSLIGQRRKAAEKPKDIAGKICLNTLIEEDKLEQINKDIYTAHEVLQMKVLWERDGIYSRYLLDNEWAFRFIPNWVTPLSSPHMWGSNKQKESDNWILAFAGMTMEKLAKWLQLWIMKKPIGMERIEEGALYFHPQDYRPKVLTLYKQKLKFLK